MWCTMHIVCGRCPKWGLRKGSKTPHFRVPMWSPMQKCLEVLKSGLAEFPTLRSLAQTPTFGPHLGTQNGHLLTWYWNRWWYVPYHISPCMTSTTSDTWHIPSQYGVCEVPCLDTQNGVFQLSDFDYMFRDGTPKWGILGTFWVIM